jgi:hypothetical protein
MRSSPDIRLADDRQLRSLVSQAFSAAFNTVSLRCRFEYVRGDNGLAVDARVKFEENDGPRGARDVEHVGDVEACAGQPSADVYHTQSRTLT